MWKGNKGVKIMSNIIYYRDNILSKVEENKDLEKLKDWLTYLVEDKEITLSVGKFSPKMKISKYTLINLISDRKEYNERMIDRYLALSFKEKEENNDTDGETE